MLDGVNDSTAHARELLAIAKHVRSKFNLIPFNPFPASEFNRSDPERIRRFAEVLQSAGLTVTTNANYNERNADLVASMKRFAGAIGFMPLSEAVLHGYQAIALDGVLATMPNYPLGIGLGFVHKGTLPPGTQAFLEYLQTESARTIMRTTGHVPVTRN